MKKILFGVVAAAAATILMAGCGTTGAVAANAAGTESAKPASNSGMTVAGKETTVVDWLGREDGSEAIPSWLSSAARKDFRAFKAAYGRPDGEVYYCAKGTGNDVRAAEARSQFRLYRDVAQSFQIAINTWSANSENISEATKDAIGTRTQAKSSVNLTGLMPVAADWKQVVEVDPITGQKSQRYIYFNIYALDAKTYATTAAKYLKEVIGDLPENLTPEQADVRNALNEMMNEGKNPPVMTEEQAKKSAEINAQIANAPSAKAGNEVLANNMQSSGTKVTTNVTRTANESGDIVYKTASTITQADKEWADADALAASILFE